MAGEPLEAVEIGVHSMLSALRRNPYAMETVYMSIITFDAKARVAVPLTDIASIEPPILSFKPGTRLGAAIDILYDSIQSDVIKTTREQKGDYRPLVFILTDGQPTDDWQGPLKKLRDARPHLARIYAIGCGDEVDYGTLSRMADVSIYMKGLSPESFAKFFVWMSASVQSMSVAPEEKVNLEKIPLQEGMELVDPDNPPKFTMDKQRLFFHVCCQKTKKNWLLSYKFDPEVDGFLAYQAVPVPDDFFSEGSMKSPSVSADILFGAQNCPYCGNLGWGKCGACQHLFCLDDEASEYVVCPVCGANLSLGDSSGFDVEGSQG
jgi:uncharacterized protein YegL